MVPSEHTHGSMTLHAVSSMSALSTVINEPNGYTTLQLKLMMGGRGEVMMKGASCAANSHHDALEKLACVVFGQGVLQEDS
jgi:hypothetical protein